MEPQVISESGKSYVYIDGRKVHGPTTHELALRKVEALTREKNSKTRKCMNCRAEFTSEGPHHRMCTTCRAQSHYDGSA